jgi:hypothetical protein
MVSSDARLAGCPRRLTIRQLRYCGMRTMSVRPSCMIAQPTSRGDGSDSTTTPFYVAPVVADVQPSTAKPGAVVAVTGSNFIDVSRVEFGGGVSAVFTVVTTNRIDAVVPAGAQAGPVAVTNPGGKGVSARSFVPASTQPQVTGFVPAFGPPGTTVTITGDNLSGTTVVRFNGLEGLLEHFGERL